jgi:hypothetical protein
LTEPVEKCPTCKGALKFVRHNEERVKQFHELLKKAVSLMHFDTRSGVILNLAVNPQSNVVKNLPRIVGCKHEPAKMLKDIAVKGPGKPALSISAGPSLDDEIDNLRRLQEGRTVLCVARLYKKLRAAGIRVDYTVSCEMFDWDSAVFDDVGDVGDTVLLYPAVVAPATLSKWPGRAVCMLDPELAVLLGEPLAQGGGNSVSHHMFNFAAEILNADPIILVGQDLAYTKGGVTHASGSEPSGWPAEVTAQDKAGHAELTWARTYGKSGRYHPECHRQTCHLGGGGFGPIGNMEVLTSLPYKNFGTLFEILIARHPERKVWNACGEGLYLEGAPYLNLSEVK